MVCDIIIKPVDQRIFETDSTKLDTLKITPGGDALNAAINMAQLGLDAALIGKVGADIFGEYLTREAEKSGVDTNGIVKSDDSPTSTSIVMVDHSGERYFAYYGKTNDSLSLADIKFDRLKTAKIVHLGSAMALASLDGPSISELFKRAKTLGAITSMDVTWDSTGKWLAKIEEALSYTDIFMPSFTEAKLISKKETPEEIAGFFEKYGIKTLAIKLGSKGCYVTDFREGYYLKPFDKVKVVDTTGAGDAFVSGFLTGIVKGWDCYQCGVFGNAVAANCIMEIGATAGIKSFDKIMKFINENQ